jgi:hypothetical protein
MELFNLDRQLMVGADAQHTAASLPLAGRAREGIPR